MSAVNSHKALLTDHEVAAQFQINLRTLRSYRWARRGPVYLRTETGRIRYDPADVEKWLAERNSTGTRVTPVTP